MADEFGKILILLEDIKSNVKTIAEGHVVLNRKIESETGKIRKEFNEQISDIKLILKEHSGILKEHSGILKEHSGILKEHSGILKEHGGILKEHSETLKDIQHDLKIHIRQTAPPAHVSF